MTEQTTDTVMEANAVEGAEAERQTVEKEIIDDTIISAGSLQRALRKCRDEAGMNIEQAAQEMRLPVHVLRALENESFSDLPEPPYVRGYLRSYARLNESDPNNLIRRYEILRGANPDDLATFTTPAALPANRNKPRSNVSSGTLKLAGLAMLVLFMGILSMIPAVSQWAVETWTSFSNEPQLNRNQQAAAGTATTETLAANGQTLSGPIDRNADDNEVKTQTAANSTTGTPNDNASNNDKPAGEDNTESLPLDTQQETSTAGTDTATADGGDNSASTTEGTETTATNTGTSTENAGEQTSATEQAASTSDDKPIAADPAAAEEKTATKTETAGTASANATATTQNTTGTASATTETPAPTQANAKAAAEKAAAEAAAKSAAAVQNSSNETTAATQQNQTPSNNFTQPHDGNVSIRLDFTQDCWMSIKNDKGQAVFSSLNTAGTRKELKARTPLTFKIGNAAGVQVYLNGQLIDQRPYTRGNVATFEVN